MARREFPTWLVYAVRAAWAIARLLPDAIVRALGRLLFSKSQTRFEWALSDPRAFQRDRLLEIVRRNQATAFGREHGFEQVTDIDSFRARVPIRGYDQFEPYIARMVAGERSVLVADDVTFFARSSGTTGAPKYIPVTESYLEEMRACRRIWSRAVSQQMPGLIRGHFLTVHSPNIEGHTPGGVPYGSITVAMAGGRDDDFTSPLEGVPRSVYRLADFELKYYLILRSALDLRISLLGALNPSTLYLLCQKLTGWADRLANDVEQGRIDAPAEVPVDIRRRLELRMRPRPAVATRIRQSLARHGLVRPVDVWPGLCGVLCWKGGSAPFYLGQLRPYLGELPIMDYGYAASEGAFSITLDAGDGRGVVGVVGHVLEFVAEAEHGSPSARPLCADQLEVGQRYAVIVTGSHGLYRYDINDIVEVVGMRHGLPEIRFVHKGGNMISITGEKIGEAHAVEAVDAALRRCQIDAAGFVLTARLADPPYYCIAIEPVAAQADTRWRTLLAACDEELRRVNIEYAAKRDSQRLGAPRLLLAPAGAFERLRAQRVAAGAPDAHVKIPHLARDPTVLDQIGVAREIEIAGVVG